MLYPLYAVLFADTGLSTAEISSLFVIWSATAFVVEVPSGMWADAFSRRALLGIGPLLTAAGFALWTLLPSYPAFAIGFILWSTQGSLKSGALQALVYDELTAAGAAQRYARLTGRARAIGTAAVLAANAVAAPVYAVGGYLAVGAASVLASVAMAAVGWSFPEPPRHATAAADVPRTWRAYLSMLPSGIAEVRRRPAVRKAVLLMMILVGFYALEEYLPLLARDAVRSTTTVVVLVTIVAIGGMVGGWWADRVEQWSVRRLGMAVTAAAALLAVGALSRHGAGFVLLAGTFAIFQVATVVTDAQLQHAITGPARATVTSLAGLGVEVSALMVYVTYAAGSKIAGNATLMATYAIPLIIIGVLLVRPRRHFRHRSRRRPRVWRVEGRTILERRPRKAAEEVHDVSAVRHW